MMDWSFDSRLPIYIQIVEQLKLAVVSGEYVPGERLPSVRELASSAGVNPNTMQKALSELESTGLVYSSRTSGRFVADNPELIDGVKRELADKNIMSFLSGMERIGIDKNESIELIKNFETRGNLHE